MLKAKEKKTQTLMQVLIVFLAPPIFYLTVILLLVTTIFELRSFNDLIELYPVYLAGFGLIAACLLLIKWTGLTVKKVLATWLLKLFPWF
jgi:hypothetical protein